MSLILLLSPTQGHYPRLSPFSPPTSTSNFPSLPDHSYSPTTHVTFLPIKKTFLDPTSTINSHSNSALCRRTPKECYLYLSNSFHSSLSPLWSTPTLPTPEVRSQSSSHSLDFQQQLTLSPSSLHLRPSLGSYVTFSSFSFSFTSHLLSVLLILPPLPNLLTLKCARMLSSVLCSVDTHSQLHTRI